MSTSATAAPRKKSPRRSPRKGAAASTPARAGRGAPTARSRAPGGRKAPAIPASLTAAARRRIAQLAGLALVGLGIAAALAILSHDARDPSFNRVADGEPKNWLGLVGSHSADLLLQPLGAASLLLALVLIVWGLRVMVGRPVGHVLLRLVVLCAAVAFAIICFAGLARLFPALAVGWPAGLGGFFGTALFGGIRELLTAWGAGLTIGLMTAMAGILSVALLLPVLAITSREWRSFGAAAGRRLRGTISRLRGREPRRSLAAKLPAQGVNAAPHGETNTVISKKPRERRRNADRRAVSKPDRHKGKDADGDSRHKAELVAGPAPRPAPGRKAQAARQGHLDLDDDTFKLPGLDLLKTPPSREAGDAVDERAFAENARYLESVLQDFGIKGEIVKVRPGPVVTLYELEPAPGVKSARIISLADDIARSMSAVSVRVAVIPGRSVIGIELPNLTRETVYLRELLAADAFERSSGRLPLVLGKNIGGGAVIADLASMPHLLIAGTTGSGKSVGINTMILSLLFRLPPARCKFIMIDPKMLELSVYDGIPQLLAPVVTEPKKAIIALRWAVREMERRYQLMSKLGVRNIESFNKRVAEAQAKKEVLTHKVQVALDDDGRPQFEDQPLEAEHLPFVVVIVDELADLMLVAGKEIEAAVQRLSQMARAAGIHLIMATQRPSVDVITGTIKANFPTRISFQVTSKIDSRTILGEQGAEQLLGQGDMLFMAGGGRITRVHGPFVSEGEVEEVVAHLKSQGEPSYLEQVTEEDESEAADMFGLGGSDDGDDLYRKAVAIVLQEGKASTSFIQRRLQIGYNRAARLIERMEQEGIVSPANHAGKREILSGAADY